MLTYDEMVEKTREFYDELQIDISDKYVDLAVRSLTMPQYAKEFNDKFHKEIGDHKLKSLSYYRYSGRRRRKPKRPAPKG